ncbi:MliC family protein [Methylopila henanensis]|uniref:MliC family protein n=1 Tax=Methylopila henanensis TaxID=873516 RepID=A0ABW4K9C0_9HYPH
MHARNALFLAPLVALALTGCAGDPRPAPPQAAAAATSTARYACDDGGFLSIRFLPDAAAVTMVDGSTATLARRAAASGLWYASGDFELRGSGDVAVWTARGSRPTSCLAT